MKKAIINVKIYDFAEFIDNGFVVFDHLVLQVGHMNDFVDDGYQIIDGQGAFLIPGLVCAHTHIYSTFARGLALPFNPKNFQEILDQMWWKIDRHIDNETSYYSGLVAASEFLRNGVTTIIDHHASGKEITGSLASLKKAVCDVSSVRALFAFEVSDRFNVEESINENANFIKQFKTPFTAGLFGLHASMSLSEETLKKVSKNLHNAPIHIHVAESEMDEEDSLAKYQERVVERLDRHGLINEDSLLVHCVHVNDKELDIIKKRKASIVVNVTSNMNNAVGLPDINKFSTSGIPVMIGNDGLSSGIANEYMNILYSAHLLHKKPTAFGLGQLLAMINNGYDYVSRQLGVKLGRIEAGYEADMLLVPYFAPTNLDKSNALGHLFYAMMHSFKPSDVFVAGEQVVKNYELTNKKLILELEKSTEIANSLWNRIKGEK
ncbi:MAG: amidohydrolase family protein [Bacilli bacterium]|nr:amidohydrolase family protein [Bacilli bacterium]